MTTDEAFAFGFLFKCAEECFPPELAEHALAAVQNPQVKQAFWKTLGQVASLPAAALAVGVPLGFGSGMAIGHYNKRKELEDAVDPSDIQQQELLDAYRMHTQQILREMADAKQLPSPQKSPEEIRKLRIARASRKPNKMPGRSVV